MIPAYSPEARGAAERETSHLEGGCPQELRLRSWGRWRREPVSGGDYIAEFNRRFRSRQRQEGMLLCPAGVVTWNGIFSLPFERSVNRDNTGDFQNLCLQIERVRWRATLRVPGVVHQHLDEP